MSKKPLFRLAVMVAAMMCALGVSAQVAYANYTPANTTLIDYMLGGTWPSQIIVNNAKP